MAGLFHGKIDTMKVIIGFGNPGNQYNFTRHNFGFLALDFYAKVHGLTFKPEPKFKADIVKDGDILFVKPQTFYNDIGMCARSIMDFYKLKPQDFLTVCDDFNLPFVRSVSASGEALAATMASNPSLRTSVLTIFRAFALAVATTTSASVLAM